jgi:hypothetical protein
MLKERGLTGCVAKAQCEAARHPHLRDLSRERLLQTLGGNPGAQIVVDSSVNALRPPRSRRDDRFARGVGGADGRLGLALRLLLALHPTEAILRSKSQ